MVHNINFNFIKPRDFNQTNIHIQFSLEARNIQRTLDMIHIHELFRLKAFSYEYIWCFHYHLLSFSLPTIRHIFALATFPWHITSEWKSKRFIILFIYTLIYSFHSFRPASRFSLYLWSITCFFMTSNTRVRKMELIIGKRGKERERSEAWY